MRAMQLVGYLFAGYEPCNLLRFFSRPRPCSAIPSSCTAESSPNANILRTVYCKQLSMCFLENTPCNFWTDAHRAAALTTPVCCIQQGFIIVESRTHFRFSQSILVQNICRASHSPLQKYPTHADTHHSHPGRKALLDLSVMMFILAACHEQQKPPLISYYILL